MKKVLLIAFVLPTLLAFSQGNRELSLQFNYVFSGTEAVELNATRHTTTDGAAIEFSTVNFYVSNIRLVPAAGNEVVLDTVLLITDNVASMPLSLGQVPNGVYQTLKFDIGIDSVRNHGDPTTYSGNHPLAYTSMFWSWNSGYIFLKVEGIVDTTSAQNASPLSPFEYHVGTDGLRKTVSLPIVLEVTSNTQSILANVDFMLGTLLSTLEYIGGVDMSTHTFDNQALASELANNMVSSFTVEVTKNEISAIGDVEASNAIHVYPNPATGDVVLKVLSPKDFDNISITSLDGKTVYNGSIISQSLILPRATFPAAGLYLVKVFGEDGLVVRKLVVQ